MPTWFETLAQLWLVMWPAVGGPATVFPSPPGAWEGGAGFASAVPASLLSVSDDELLRRLDADPGSVGPLSLGAPGSGRLFNAVAFPPGPRWVLLPGAVSWATSETVAAIEQAIDTVHELYADSPPLCVGDISAVEGGRLKRHETHQSGRDVDLGFYLRGEAPRWFVNGTAANLDLPRNWALVRALVVYTDVETILLDTRIQRLLYKYALGIGEDREWLDRVFQFSRGSRDAIVKHVRNHRNHYHVRFYNPVAQELGRRAHPLLVQLEVLPPPVYTVKHVVRPGQTLGHLASRYGTSVRAIMAANGLTSTALRAGRAYRIPVRTPAPPTEPVVVPPRLLPPSTPAALAALEWPTAPEASDVAGDGRAPGSPLR